MGSGEQPQGAGSISGDSLVREEYPLRPRQSVRICFTKLNWTGQAYKPADAVGGFRVSGSASSLFCFSSRALIGPRGSSHGTSAAGRKATVGGGRTVALRSSLFLQFEWLWLLFLLSRQPSPISLIIFLSVHCSTCLRGKKGKQKCARRIRTVSYSWLCANETSAAAIMAGIGLDEWVVNCKNDKEKERAGSLSCNNRNSRVLIVWAAWKITSDLHSFPLVRVHSCRMRRFRLRVYAGMTTAAEVALWWCG